MATENYSSFANGQEESMDVTETQNGDQNKDEDQRKIFVGGLRAETTASDLREYFSQYGTVEDASLKTDQYTGRSRGFGFVTFADPSDVEKVIDAKSHTIGGRNVEPRRALARPGKEPVLKAFVGGLDPSVPEAEIKEYFEQYGKVVEIELPFDKVKNQRRAFCFVKFETEDEVELAVKETKQVVSGKTVDVKKGVPPRSDKRGGRGGYGGRGGGRGGYYGGGWDYDGYGYDSYGYGGYDSYGYGNDYYGNDYYGQGSWGGGGGYGGYGGYGKGGRGGSGGPRGGAGKSRGRGGRGGSGYHPYNK